MVDSPRDDDPTPDGVDRQIGEIMERTETELPAAARSTPRPPAREMLDRELR